MNRIGFNSAAHLLDDVGLEASVVVNYDVVGGRHCALADVLRHQEEVVPVPLCHLRDGYAITMKTICGSSHRVIQNCSRSWVFRHLPPKLEDSCVDSLLHNHKPNKTE